MNMTGFPTFRAHQPNLSTQQSPKSNHSPRASRRTKNSPKNGQGRKNISPFDSSVKDYRGAVFPMIEPMNSLNSQQLEAIGKQLIDRGHAATTDRDQKESFRS